MYYNTLNSFITPGLRKPPSYKIYFTHYHRIVGHVSFDQSTVFAWSSKLQRKTVRIGDKKLSSLQHFWYSLNLKTIFHFWRLKLKLLHFYIDFNVEAKHLLGKWFFIYLSFLLHCTISYWLLRHWNTLIIVS